MVSFSTVSFSEIFIKQSQNTARLAFEVQFQSIKRRLDTELNKKKEVYNNMDKTLEPMLAGYKRERNVLDQRKTELSTYLQSMGTNIKKVNDVINNLIPRISAAASQVGPTAEADFNALRDQLNKALRTLIPATSYGDGLIDRTKSIKVKANPSGIGDYSSYATVPDRANAVGILLTGGEDGLQVMPGLSYGYAEEIGFLRNRLMQDFDVAKRKLGETETQTNKDGKIVTDDKGKPVVVGKSGIYKQMYDIDKKIEKVDAEQRLVVLRDIQAMEKKNDQLLQNLSLSFEFQQSNMEILSDRTSFMKPQKGSIMNLFV